MCRQYVCKFSPHFESLAKRETDWMPHPDNVNTDVLVACCKLLQPSNNSTILHQILASHTFSNSRRCRLSLVIVLLFFQLSLGHGKYCSKRISQEEWDCLLSWAKCQWFHGSIKQLATTPSLSLSMRVFTCICHHHYHHLLEHYILMSISLHFLSVWVFYCTTVKCIKQCQIVKLYFTPYCFQCNNTSDSYRSPIRLNTFWLSFFPVGGINSKIKSCSLNPALNLEIPKVFFHLIYHNPLL